jgi:threonine/homoserine/homoserine lactone efflux protein
MDGERLLAYAATLTALNAVPGPFFAVVVARALARDRPGALAFALGIGAGDLAAVALVLAGPAAWAAGIPGVAATLRWLGAAWLGWLAVSLWRSPATRIVAAGARRPPVALALAGALACLGNPQTHLLYLALLPAVLEPDGGAALDVAAVLAVTFASTAGVHVALACLAGRARPAPPGRLWRRVMALATAGSAAWLALA